MTNPGLSSSAITDLQAKHGLNQLTPKASRSPINILLSQFKSYLVLLLFIATFISFYFQEYIDAFFILTIIILNAILGFYQEFKAEKAVAALAKMTRSSVRVIRDSHEQVVDSIQLVPGDIVVLSEGDKIAADGHLLESSSLEINESALTGESNPVKKSQNSERKTQNESLADTDSINDLPSEICVYSGTLVTKGHGLFQVTAIGMQTRFGKIAQTLQTIQEHQTPLQQQLSRLGLYLAIGSVLICALIFAVGLLRGIPFYEILLLSISLAVAAVPEGLPAIVTITLALGVTQMAKRHAIIRRLSSVETLGSVQVICTDKTGTLTTNQMTVRAVWHNPELTNPDLLPAISALCNTAKLITANHQTQILGDTTEGALLTHLATQKIAYEQIRSQYQIIQEFPFDSNRKMMTVIVTDQPSSTSNNHLVLSKGAPEVILAKSTHTNEQKAQIQQIVAGYASQGLRTLALAYKNSNSTDSQDQNKTESDLQIVAIVGISDPPRPEVQTAILAARSAGVRTIMLTGDNLQTAIAIGTEIGLYKPKTSLALEGTEFAKLSDQQITKIIPKITIIARCQPEDKLRLVQLLQKSNLVVASTGDGVNDSLHIKQADIGIAMGITGTDVSKEASDMILADDNYSTIIAAIEEGRRIYHNIKNSIHYLISTNLGEIIAIAGAVFLFPGGEAPRTPLMVLWINLVTDGLPALALATDVVDRRLMRQPPRSKDHGIISRQDWSTLLCFGLAMAIITLGTFYLGFLIGGVELGRTWSFIAIVLMQLIRFIIIRKASPFNNLNIATVLLLTMAVHIFVSLWSPTRHLLGITE